MQKSACIILYEDCLEIVSEGDGESAVVHFYVVAYFFRSHIHQSQIILNAYIIMLP